MITISGFHCNNKNNSCFKLLVFFFSVHEIYDDNLRLQCYCLKPLKRWTQRVNPNFGLALLTSKHLSLIRWMNVNRLWSQLRAKRNKKSTFCQFGIHYQMSFSKVILLIEAFLGGPNVGSLFSTYSLSPARNSNGIIWKVNCKVKVIKAWFVLIF